MKTLLRITIINVCLTFMLLAGCDTTGEKLQDERNDVIDSKKDVVEAKANLQKAILDSINEFKRFKSESELRISVYEQNIAELKVKIANEKPTYKTKYQKMIADLEAKTLVLKSDLKEYREDNRDNWFAFKKNFNENMDTLGSSITYFFTKDAKK